MKSTTCAIILVALAAIGNGYYFPNGAPNRQGRDLTGNNSHPEPKQLHPEPPPQDDPNPIPLFKMEGDGSSHPEPRAVPKPEFKEQMPLQLIPARKEFPFADRRRQSGCQFSYSFANPGDTATIQSENYPNEYGNNIDSSVCFASPEGTTMTVNCDVFNVEYERSCSYDYLGLGFGGSPSDVQKYCGRGTLQSRPTTANRLAVVFKSDVSNPGRNREAYRFQCKITVSGQSGGGDNGGSQPPSDGSCSCGVRNDQRIVGGQVAKVNEFPWRCYLKTNSYSFFCGCSIISNNWILTAAHCTQAVMPLRDGDKLYAVIGDHDRSTSQETQSQQIEISNVYDHPQYDDQTMDNDMSLLKVRSQIVYGQTISPVCLPFAYANDDFSGTTVSASGWGTTSQGGQVSNQLREVDLPVLTTEQCSRYYPGQITENMICTYQPGKDTCQGDSGGSIDLQRNGRYYHIGVVSWGIGCARENNPGVYAKVTKYLDWIRQTTNGENFCQP